MNFPTLLKKQNPVNFTSCSAVCFYYQGVLCYAHLPSTQDILKKKPKPILIKRCGSLQPLDLQIIQRHLIKLSCFFYQTTSREFVHAYFLLF